LAQKCPWIKNAKTIEGIFAGPQTKKFMNDMNFDEMLEETEKTAWEAIRLVSDNFLCRYNAPTYTQKVEEMPEVY
jgi:hypothetical protein